MAYEWTNPFRYKDASTNSLFRLMNVADELRLISQFFLAGKSPTTEQREMMNDAIRQYELLVNELRGGTYVDL